MSAPSSCLQEYEPQNKTSSPFDKHQISLAWTSALTEVELEMETTSVSLFRRWLCIVKSGSPLESALHSIGDVYWHSSLKFLGISGAYVFRASEHLVYPAERGSSKRAFACVRAAGASEGRNSDRAISLLGFCEEVAGSTPREHRG